MFSILILDKKITNPDEDAPAKMSYSPNRVIGPFPSAEAAFMFMENNSDWENYDPDHSIMVLPLDNPLMVAREQGRQFGNDGKLALNNS